MCVQALDKRAIIYFSYFPSFQVTFTPETVEPICYKAIEAVLKDKMYNPIQITPWVDEICSRVTKDLIDMNKPFKYLGKLHI